MRRIGPVAPVAAHRRDVPAQAMLARAIQFYRRKLRALAGARRDAKLPPG